MFFLLYFILDNGRQVYLLAGTKKSSCCPSAQDRLEADAKALNRRREKQDEPEPQRQISLRSRDERSHFGQATNSKAQSGNASEGKRGWGGQFETSSFQSPDTEPDWQRLSCFRRMIEKSLLADWRSVCVSAPQRCVSCSD